MAALRSHEECRLVVCAVSHSICGVGDARFHMVFVHPPSKVNFPALRFAPRELLLSRVIGKGLFQMSRDGSVGIDVEKSASHQLSQNDIGGNNPCTDFLRVSPTGASGANLFLG
jgi:hypothetical protein